MSRHEQLSALADATVANLTPQERVAVAVLITDRVSDPGCFADLRHASRLIREHGDQLLLERLTEEPGNLVQYEEAPRRPGLLARLDDGVFGDVIGGLCVAVLAYAAFVIAGVLQ
ncbi:hypothetical protein [Litorisediminicola beolgyonensis]|uniref:Uncharacterized protein n=1 Tax=Litorisediminicola beolgyonensis TaxID=1173614 RepID=A0ABW3ZJI4_9RHOB